MHLKKIAHVLLRVADKERSQRFYMDVLGFRIAEEEPGAVFMTLGADFHTLDITQHPNPDAVQRPRKDQVGLNHIAFQVDSYDGIRDAYVTLQEKGVPIEAAIDHVSQRSLYFLDPDGNRLEIYFEVPNALTVFANGRNDQDVPLPLSQPGEPLPDWLFESWPPAREAVGSRQWAVVPTHPDPIEGPDCPLPSE